MEDKNCRFFWNANDTPVSENSISTIFCEQLEKTPTVNMEHSEKIWKVASMLPTYLESFSDSLLIMKDSKPMGTIGGRELMSAIFFNPSFDLLDDTTAETIVKKSVNLVQPTSSLSHVISVMQRQRLAFVIFQNQKLGFSCISSRTMLVVGTNCKTNMLAGDVSKKPTITFSRNDTVGKVISTMFHNQTRRLLLEDSEYTINDRAIIEHIVTRLNYLDGVDNFLEMNIAEFKFQKITSVSKDVPIPDLCKIMLTQESPCLIVEDQVITPWDIVNLLK